MLYDFLPISCCFCSKNTSIIDHFSLRYPQFLPNNTASVKIFSIFFINNISELWIKSIVGQKIILAVRKKVVSLHPLSTKKRG